jgi:hypothetical protein
MSPTFLHTYGLVYQNYYLCPVTAPGGFTFQLLTTEGEFMSNDTSYPSPEAAVEAGQQFLERWCHRCSLTSLCEELYEQGRLSYSEYRHLSQKIREVY